MAEYVMLPLIHYEWRPVEYAPRHAIGLLDHTELPLPSLAECAEAIRLLCRRGLTYVIPVLQLPAERNDSDWTRIGLGAERC